MLAKRLSIPLKGVTVRDYCYPFFYTFSFMQVPVYNFLALQKPIFSGEHH